MMDPTPIEELGHEFGESSKVLCRGLNSKPLLLAVLKLQLICIELMARVELAESGGES